MTKRALDLFAVFKQIDAGRFDFYEHLSDEEKKEVSPLIIQRWMSTGSERQLMFLNAITNRLLFSLPKDKELMCKLLVVCSEKRFNRKTWLKLPARKRSERLALEVLKQVHGYSTREAELSFTLVPPGDIIEGAERLGWEEKQVKELKKELGL